MNGWIRWDDEEHRSSGSDLVEHMAGTTGQSSNLCGHGHCRGRHDSGQTCRCFLDAVVRSPLDRVGVKRDVSRMRGFSLAGFDESDAVKVDKRAV